MKLTPPDKKSKPAKSSSEELTLIILQQLAAIPISTVCTYGDLAKLSGFPNHSRFVGSVLRKLPKDSSLPWFRVINGQGKISFPLDSKAFKRQRDLLEKEGIFLLNGRIDLKRFRIKI